MYRERLTAEELEVLLTAGEVGEGPAGPSEPTGGEQETHTDNALAELHVRFADDLSSLLSELARREVLVKPRDAGRGTYAQFVLGQKVPTCCAVVVAAPLQTEFFFAIAPTILLPILDRALGSNVAEPAPHRTLTEIESALSTSLLELVLAKYREAWQHVLSLEFAVDRLECNAQQMRALAGSEPVYLVRYDVRCGRDQGGVEWCLPWNPTQQMRERLAANRQSHISLSQDR